MFTLIFLDMFPSHIHFDSATMGRRFLCRSIVMVPMPQIQMHIAVVAALALRPVRVQLLSRTSKMLRGFFVSHTSQPLFLPFQLSSSGERADVCSIGAMCPSEVSTASLRLRNPGARM